MIGRKPKQFLSTAQNLWFSDSDMIADARTIRKLGLGPRPEDPLGLELESWIDQQLDLPPVRRGIPRAMRRSPEIELWPDSLVFTLEERVERAVEMRRLLERLDRLKLPENERGDRRRELWDKYELHRADSHRFAHTNVYAKDHVNVRLAVFWLNHFTVGDIAGPVRQLIMDYFDEAIVANLGSSFSDLLFSTISHPAMLTYLDNIHSVGDNSRNGRYCRQSGKCHAGLNDNLARELLELHTVSPARGYTEDDIRDTAKVLAGWGFIFNKPRPKGAAGLRPPFDTGNAEPGQKTVLGKSFGSGSGALRQLTDFLAADPSTVRHLSEKLALHFVGDDYSESNVTAVSNAWKQSNGTLRDIHRAVLLEAAKSKGTKFLTPSLWLHQLLRMSDAHLFRGFEEIDDEPEGVRNEAWMVYAELGDDFWSRRQPDGFSDRKADWVSNEHLDRRYRFADLVFSRCNPRLNADEMIEKYGFSESTRNLVEQVTSSRDKFILFACSPEFMEV